MYTWAVERSLCAPAYTCNIIILALNKHRTSRRAEINKRRYILMREYGIPSCHLLLGKCEGSQARTINPI